MRTASGLAMAVVVVALLVAGGTALKLYMDQQSMLAMIDDYGRAIAGLPLSAGPAAKSLATAKHHADRGEYGAARRALDQVVAMVSQGPVPTGPPGAPPGQGGPVPGLGFGPNPGQEPPAPTDEDIDQALNNDLPEPTRAFFTEHRDLLSRLMVQNSITMGAIDPDEWQRYTSIVLGAAAEGDLETVKAAMDRFDEAVNAAQQGQLGPPGLGGGPGEGGVEEAIRAQIGQVKGIVAQAKKAGVNTKRVERLLAQAENLAGHGKFEQADAKLRQTLPLIRKWQEPRRQPPGRGRVVRRPIGPGGGPQPGNPMMMAPMILNALIGLMETEEPLIFAAIEDLDNAGHAMLEYNQDQIREIINKAKEKLASIPKKRIEMDQKIASVMQEAQSQAGRGGDRPRDPGQGGQGQRPGGPGTGPPMNPQQARNLLGRMVDNARSLSEGDYEARRDGLIDRFMARLMGQPAPEGPPTGPDDAGMPTDVEIGAPRIEIPEEEPSDPEARDELESQVRELMRMFQEPYIDLKQLELEIDLGLIDQLVDSARDDVNEGKLVDAASNANHASELIFQLVQMHGPELQALEAPPEPDAAPADATE